MSSKDVESLQPTVRHRDKSVYVCLGCLTFALVVISLGGGAMFLFMWRELQSQVASTKSTGSKATHSAPLPDEGTFKSGHVAYVRATNGEVRNQTMKWEAIETKSSSSSIGTNYNYSSTQSMLKVLGEGSYYIYMDISFVKTATECKSSSIVEVTLKSDNAEVLPPCVVELDCQVTTPVTNRCWDVVHLKRGSRLSGHMTVRTPNSPNGGFGWKLVSNNSGFGMFFVGS